MDIFIDAAIERCVRYDNTKTYRLLNFNRDDYIDRNHVRELYNSQKGLCTYCSCILRLDNSRMRLSVDRIKCHIGHIRGNCQLACIWCNLDKKDMRDDLYRERTFNWTYDLIESLKHI